MKFFIVALHLSLTLLHNVFFHCFCYCHLPFAILPPPIFIRPIFIRQVRQVRHIMKSIKITIQNQNQWYDVSYDNSFSNNFTSKHLINGSHSIPFIHHYASNPISDIFIYKLSSSTTINTNEPLTLIH